MELNIKESTLYKRYSKLLEQYQHKSKIKRSFELTLYTLFSLWLLNYLLPNYYSDLDKLGKVSKEYSLSIFFRYVIISSTPLLFALTFSLIFSYFPIELIRINLSKNERRKIEQLRSIRRNITYKFTSTSQFESNPIDFLVQLIDDSKSLANNIFNRAGVYLFVGILIALGGIYFYASITGFTTNKIQYNSENIMIVMLPRFGVLIFIELIAFFFLRQYKLTMNEFKFYHNIKRIREEQLLYIRLLLENDKYKDIINILSNLKVPGNTSLDDSSLLGLNTQIEKEDIDILAKIISAIKKSVN